jgi:hypothetical protein
MPALVELTLQFGTRRMTKWDNKQANKMTLDSCANQGNSDEEVPGALTPLAEMPRKPPV